MKLSINLLGAAVLGLGLMACDPPANEANNADANAPSNAAASNTPEQTDTTPEPANSTSETTATESPKPADPAKPADPVKASTADEKKQAMLDAEDKKANLEKEGEGKITDMKATKDPNMKPPVPPQPKVNTLRKQVIARAEPSKTKADFLGTWRFEMPADKKAEIEAAFKKNAKTKNLKAPESTLTVKSDGTFEINEVMIVARKILGSYTIKSGVGTFVIKTVNGKPPVQLADKRGFVAVIDKSGKLIHETTLEYTKK